MGSILARWRRAPLGSEAAAALATERRETNRRRLRVLAPVMAVVHLVHVWLFYVPDELRASHGAADLQWRDGLFVVHLATIPFVVVMGAAALLLRSPRVLGLLGPLTAVGYLVHGAAITGVDQIVTANMTAYIAYSLGLAVILALTPLEAAVAYLAGAGAMLWAMLGLSTSTAAQSSNVPTIATLTVVSVMLAWLGDGARRRELVQRLTIARQREQLAELNTGLERRVREQVDEIVARAAQVERLNAELQAQVRARSTELSQALQRLSAQMQASHGLEAGAVVAGRFVVESAIGEGAMGKVYAGLDRTTGARVAIKVMQVSSTHQLDALRRFIREAGATAAVSHPAVVRVLAVDVSDDGLLYQIQELVEGETLTHLAAHAWPPADAARLGAVLAEALAVAHAHGVVHRDVKPENVMLTRSAPGLKLLDFGIAKLHDAVAGGDRTQESVILGTPAYMAPEQVAAGDDVGDRADVYAVGVMLYQLIAARLPVDAPTARELMLRKLAEEPTPLSVVAPTAPAALVTLVQRCLARAPEHRPSAAELATQLRELADHDGVPRLEAMARPEAVGSAATLVERGRR